jgi:glucose-6-phosphate isomerase
MKLDIQNSPSARPISEVTLPQDAKFLSYIPDLEAIKQLAEKYQNYKNILVIGHGGSITSFLGMYSALHGQATKKAYFLSTVDPDYISELKNELAPGDTLVIAISKSGETVTQIEALSEFLDYPLLFITGPNSTLAQIAEARGGEVVNHPPIGGRYTGFTEIALLPAALCGFDVKAIFEAGRAFHQLFATDNEAWRAASVLAQLEQQDYLEVFMPFYSHDLFGVSNLIVQLCHESFGKDGKGQTYFAHESPESQHHTNQRFLGGRKNIAGFFTSVRNFRHSLTTAIPQNMEGIGLKDGTLHDLSAIPLQESMRYEMEATKQDAIALNIPVLHYEIEQLDEKHLGEYIAFWQMYAVYASVIRGVNPFDQPAVENSKKISFQKRLDYKK